MRILAIESSAVTASVAILTDDTLTAEYTINYKKTHSQTLLPMIDEICDMTDVKPDEFDVVAVSTGPGSFTGLRIGVATGKGIALATGIKMAAVPTLDAMAMNMYGTGKLICAVMDARRQHLYNNIFFFDENNKLCRCREQSLDSYDQLAAELNGLNRDVIFVGDGINAAREYFDKYLTCKYEYAPAHMTTQRAGSVAMLAMQMAAENRLVDADDVKPDYLRPSQAEREFAQKKEPK